MTIIKHPDGLPVPNPTQSYWRTPPLGIDNERTTPDLPKSAKYVIVGSGITGSLTAYKILQHEPKADIVMLEARQACSGATGRNGGHCRAGDYGKFEANREIWGLEDALRMETMEEKTVRGVANLVEKEHIRCDFRSVETCDVFTDAKKWSQHLIGVKNRRAIAKDHPEWTEHKLWQGESAQKRFLVPNAYGAISFPGHRLNPYKLVCGLLHLNIAKGMNLQTTTPVVRLKRESCQGSEGKWIVYTSRGDIKAEKVILATNAYTAALYPALSSFIIPTRGQVAAVRPGSRMVDYMNIMESTTFGLENHIHGDYVQTRGEGMSGTGDMIVGGGRLEAPGGEHNIFDDSTIHPKVSEYLTHCLAEFFGKNWGVNGKVLQEWSGIMGYTVDTHPVVGEAPGEAGLFICAGFNGHGMGLTFQAAEAVVQLLLGKQDEVDTWLPKAYRLARVPQARPTKEFTHRAAGGEGPA